MDLESDELERFELIGSVFTTIVPQEAVLMMLFDREGAEVVVDPATLPPLTNASIVTDGQG